MAASKSLTRAAITTARLSAIALIALNGAISHATNNGAANSRAENENLNFKLSALAASTPLAVSAPETTAIGPYQTSTTEYKLPAKIDADVLPGVTTELWGRVFWPTAIQKLPQKRPLLLFLHGNHGTCGTGSKPRNDSTCTYTSEGVCSDGAVVTPNHEGYNYVAQHLASWGYVVVSINANRGITCGGGDSDDWGLILARGRLILKHLQIWNDWSTQGGAPGDFGDSELFKEHVDLREVGLMGHSRGGEGIRAALNLFRDSGSPWPSRIPNLDIKALYEIGAVDGQSSRTLDAEGVAWNQLLPLCDGDVSNLEGRQPFERMTEHLFSKQKSESRSSMKSLTMVWGANHNFFNTEWQSNDSWSCAGGPEHQPLYSPTSYSSDAQQAVALQSMTAFFRAHVGPERDPTLAQQFDPAFNLPKGLTAQAKIDRDYIPGLNTSDILRVEDFTAATGKNPAGPSNSASGISIQNNTSHLPIIGQIKWAKPGDDVFYQTNFREVGNGADLSRFTYLDFRVGRVYTTRDLSEKVDFSVQLVTADDALLKAVAIANYARVQGPPNGSTELTQTVRIPLTDLDQGGLKSIRGVRFVFNKTNSAQIRIAQVRFGIGGTNMLAGTIGGHPVLLHTEPNTPARLETVANNGPVFRAEWGRKLNVAKSRFLKGARGVELSVNTLSQFPVMDAVPVLNIENNLFPVARYPSNGRTETLIFSIPRAVYDRLPVNGRAQVQYGIAAPSRIWTLPDFDKKQLGD